MDITQSIIGAGSRRGHPLPELNLGQGALGEAQDLAELALGQSSALPEVTHLIADEAFNRTGYLDAGTFTIF